MDPSPHVLGRQRRGCGCLLSLRTFVVGQGLLGNRAGVE